jgi:hypothetical protein
MTTVFKNALQNNVSPALAVTTVTASSPSANSVTLGFATQATTPFPIGSYIYVSGISVSSYNGYYAVTGATASSVTYANTTTTAATGGTITTVLWQSNASAKTTVIGISLTNTTANIITASVQLQDTVATTTAYYANNIIIPGFQSLRLVSQGEKLILGPSTNMLITTNTAGSLDVIASYVEIS